MQHGWFSLGRSARHSVGYVWALIGCECHHATPLVPFAANAGGKFRLAGGRIDRFAADRRARHQVLLVGARPSVREMLERQGVLRLVDPESCYERRIDALHDAARLVAAAA